MAILVCSVDAFPHIGGISVMAHELCNAFQSEGQQTYFLGPSGVSMPDDRDCKYVIIEDRKSQKKIRHGAHAINEDKRIRDSVAEIIREHSIERIIALHPFYYGIGALAAARALNIPFSVYFHGFELKSQMIAGRLSSCETPVWSKMSQTLPNRTHYLISHADEILTNSNYTKNLVREVEGNTFTKVTGCGISKEKYEEVLRENSRYDRADKLRKRLNIAYCKYFWGKDTILLSYVGRLSHEKNVERIIDICNEDSQFVAIIAGVGPKEEALKKRVNDLGLSDRVVFAGRVTEGEKWDIWQASDFGMLMSEPNEETGNVEGFGIVLLECAVCGAIPICSGVGGMVDCVEDGQTGRIFAPTLSASEVAFQLKRLFDDQPEMQRLVSNAQKQVSEKFNWEAIAKEILKYPPAVRGAKIMLEKTFLHHYLTKMSNVLRKKRK